MLEVRSMKLSAGCVRRLTLMSVNISAISRIELFLDIPTSNSWHHLLDEYIQNAIVEFGPD